MLFIRLLNVAVLFPLLPLHYIYVDIYIRAFNTFGHSHITLVFMLMGHYFKRFFLDFAVQRQQQQRDDSQWFL